MTRLIGYEYMYGLAFLQNTKHYYYTKFCVKLVAREVIMSPRLPAPSAHSSDVRAYIARALVSRLGIASNIADETARLWKDGRGAELCDFTARAFKSVFGEQTGLSLFRIVHEDKLQDWKQSTIGVLSFCKSLFLW